MSSGQSNALYKNKLLFLNYFKRENFDLKNLLEAIRTEILNVCIIFNV